MTKRVLLKLQVAVLAAGTVFSWVTLAFDYRRFFASGGQVFELSGCAVANPLVTPCFYGALAFLLAFGWSVLILRARADEVSGKLGRLRLLLVAGTLFAWGNFVYVVYRYVQAKPASVFTCPPGEPAVYPLTAPCFYGALIFTAALIVSVLAGRARS